jgi:tetratricopeptide (TPR) repeat protein
MTNNSQTLGQLLFAKLKINLDEVLIEQLPNYVAAQYYLVCHDDPPLESSNLHKVERFLQAFDQLIEVNNWEKSWLIGSENLDFPNNENLFEQLGIWGYYKEIDKRLKFFIDKDIPSRIKANCFLILGNANWLFGNKELALDYFQNCFNLAHKFKEKDIESRVLITFGNLDRLQQKYDKAIENLNNGINIAREINNGLLQATGLSFLGLIYSALQDIEKSKEYYLEGLRISEEINNLQWQLNILTNLANVYRDLGDYDVAQQMLDKSLNISQKTGDRYAEGWVWYQLGLLQKALSNFAEAVDFFKRAKKLFKELENSSGQEQVQREILSLESHQSAVKPKY